MTLEKDEQILMVLRKSRKAYLAEYLCGVIILGLLVGLAAKGVLLPALPRNLTLGFALFCLGFAEVKRLFLRYKITPTKVITIHGFIKQTKKKHLFPPPGIHPRHQYPAEPGSAHSELRDGVLKRERNGLVRAERC